MKSAILTSNRSYIDSKKSSQYKHERIYQSLKINLLSILGKSSFHGFPSLSSQNVKLSIKILWLACICASWGYFAYQAYNTVLLIQAYPKVTLVSKVNEQVPYFPSKILALILLFLKIIKIYFSYWFLQLLIYAI